MYFISGPALVIVAILGLQQIKVAKRALEVQSRRDAYRIAAEQINFFVSEVMNAHSRFVDALEENDIQFFEQSDVSVDGDKFIVSTCKDNVEIDKLSLIVEESAALINGLEQFAFYFVSKIADEEIAYQAAGQAYCDVVTQLLPIIAPALKRGKQDNIFQLFFVWNMRLHSDEAEIHMEELEKKLKRNPKIRIIPIGLRND